MLDNGYIWFEASASGPGVSPRGFELEVEAK